MIPNEIPTGEALEIALSKIGGLVLQAEYMAQRITELYEENRKLMAQMEGKDVSYNT